MTRPAMPEHEQMIDRLEAIGPVYAESSGSPDRAAERALEDACSMLRAMAARIAFLTDALRRASTVQQTYYGHSTGGNPHHFTPDEEACSPEEIANHREALGEPL